ncbi:energy transducer TonB [Janthinobacterium sp. SUN118]|uniref:energy transducer TonB n=1 Tax=Janthinobacterium sp. SUN118 TaxID=3004100 RepID=UPI0025B1D4B8|nr:energy transducer TonB [Janthinobacterium sp. SUN118]MDN2710870.1 energy transducer TonB [Janthinobacterium sp. SUN118]
MRQLLTVLAAATLLAACQKAPAPIAQAPASPPTASTPRPGPVQPPATIDAYKLLVAQQIMDANPQHTFSGRLPPMLPAIVVLDLSVERDGSLKNVRVHRSRDNEASKAALAAVRRVPAAFPPAAQLMRGRDKTLDFSETFLFNDEYRFQLRTLSGPQ